MQTAQCILDRKGAEVYTVGGDATVLDAARVMNERHIGSLVVTQGDKAVGIFTERDILCRVVAVEMSPSTTAVRDVMTSPMAVCRRDTPLSVCQSIMHAKRIRHLPVVEEGRLYGLISTKDLINTEVEDQQHHIEYLHEYMHGRV